MRCHNQPLPSSFLFVYVTKTSAVLYILRQRHPHGLERRISPSTLPPSKKTHEEQRYRACQNSAGHLVLILTKFGIEAAHDDEDEEGVVVFNGRQSSKRIEADAKRRLLLIRS